MLCLECGTLFGRDLDSDKSRQEAVRRIRKLDLERNVRNQLEVTNMSVLKENEKKAC